MLTIKITEKPIKREFKAELEFNAYNMLYY